MIHHVSISARDPKHVAEVLAEVMNGRCYPFPGGVADSFMAVSGDEHGSMIEVYPESVTLEPGLEDDQQCRSGNVEKPGYVPFHLLLSVPVDRAAVERIGTREGWRTQYYGRGRPGQKPFFHVIEFWVENRIMVEIATPEMVGEYLGMIGYDKLDVLFSRRAA